MVKYVLKNSLRNIQHIRQRDTYSSSFLRQCYHDFITGWKFFLCKKLSQLKKIISGKSIKLRLFQDNKDVTFFESHQARHLLKPLVVCRRRKKSHFLRLLLFRHDSRGPYSKVYVLILKERPLLFKEQTLNCFERRKLLRRTGLS